MDFERLDEIILAFAYIELLGYTAKGLLYYFGRYRNSEIILTEEGLVEMRRPMIYNFIRLIYRDLTSKLVDEDLSRVENLEESKLYS